MRKWRRSAERPGKAGHLSRVARPVLNMAELGRHGGPSREFLESNLVITLPSLAVLVTGYFTQWVSKPIFMARENKRALG